MKFHAYGTVTGTKYLGEFEAQTAEEARELASASAEAYVSVCHHCASEVSDPEITEILIEVD